MKKIVIALVVIVLVALVGWFALGKVGHSGNPKEEVAKNMIGKWQSVEYKLLTREFREDGAVTDVYAGEEGAIGVWELFDSSTVPESYTLFNSDEEAVYMRMSLTGEESDMIYFLVQNVDQDHLELVYLGRKGGSLNFTRVR